MQPRVERQRALRRGTVVGPAIGGDVVGLGLGDVGPGAERAVRIDRLEQLLDAAGDEQVAVGERQHARVPAADLHRGRLRPGVRLRIEDPGVLEPLELRDPQARVGHLGVEVVRGASGRKHPAVGEEDQVGAEQGPVVVRLAVPAREDLVVVVAVGVGAAVDRARPAKARLAALAAQRQHPRLVVDDPRAPRLGDDRELHPLGALERVPVEDPPVRHDRERARGRLAVDRPVLGRDALRVRPPAVDLRLLERLAEPARDGGIGGHRERREDRPDRDLLLVMGDRARASDQGKRTDDPEQRSPAPDHSHNPRWNIRRSGDQRAGSRVARTAGRRGSRIPDPRSGRPRRPPGARSSAG